MDVLSRSSEDEMVACYLAGELSSERWGAQTRAALAARGLSEDLLTHADISDEAANDQRRAVLAVTRGYREDREMFEHFADDVRWVWARLQPAELVRVRYIEYDYWNELSGGSRLPVDAARHIREGLTVFGVPNTGFLRAADAATRGEGLPPLILAGPTSDHLVCLEGHLRLTGHALAGFPRALDCLVGTSPKLVRWAA